ncbi:MAG TPA: DUF2997 domain-containing protein [Candidatus Poseidoniales archaeon]|jgi:hypothetical protein|nr:DUF2997 domain-containing protein [Candidatus Poseidoniales archaeon]
MKEQRIVVTIDADGKMSAKTTGLKGETCIEELEALLAELAELDGVEHTREYHEKEPRASQQSSNKQQLKGGN